MALHPGRILPVEIHTNYPMGAPDQPIEPMYQVIPDISREYSDNPSTNPNSFGAGMSLATSPNRGPTFVVGTTFAAVQGVLDSRCLLDDTAIARVSIDRDFDAATGTVTGTVHVTFEAAPGTGDFRIGLYAVEDSVTGPDPNYSQYDDADPANWPVRGFVHPWVLRGELLNNSFWGEGGIIPSTPAVGVTYDAPFTYVLPDLYYDVPPVPEHIALYAFVVKKVSVKAGQIYNCESAPFVGHSTAIVGNAAGVGSYLPGEFSAGRLRMPVAVGIHTMSIFGIDGRLVRSFSVDGNGGMKSFDCAGIPQGIYVARAGASVFRFIADR